MKQSITLKSTGPFLLLTFIYFIVGFLTTVNDSVRDLCR